MSRHAKMRKERAFAAPAALLALVLAATIAAAMAELSRVEVVVARARTVTAAALAAVDACAEDAVAALAAGWEFDDVLAGADAVAGTADDGMLLLPADCTGAARAAPGPPSPPRVVLELEAVHGAGRRRLEALVRRRAEPGVPSLIWASGAATLGRITGTLLLDGNDPARPLAPARATLAGPAEPEAFDAWAASQGAALAATAGTAPPSWAGAPPLGALVARAAAAGALPPSAGLAPAPPATPAVTLATSDLAVDAPLYGAGLLVVDGVLTVDAPFRFTGVVAATGGLRVGATGTADVEGALWLGASALEALVVDGHASVVASAAALEAADALLALPRRPALGSVRDF